MDMLLHYKRTSVKDLYILPGKYSPPSVQGIIHKQRLLDHLTARKDRKLFLIHGKAGDGKTTLAADFIARIGVPALWYRVGPEDTSPDVFLHNLLLGMHSVFDIEIPKAVSEIEQRSRIDEKIALFLSFLRPLLEQELFFVLDDFHYLSAVPDIVRGITLLLENTPDSHHFIIISRTYPPDHFYAMRAAKKLIELRQEDLVFTKSEARQLVDDQYQIHFEPGEFERVLHITRGWIGGLIYLLEHLSKMDREQQKRQIEYFLDTKRLRNLDDFFREQVIPFFSKQRKDILISCSLFHEINPAIVTLCSGVGDVFEELERENTFVHHQNGSDSAVTLHPLFGAYLRKLFNALPEKERTDAHRTAAEYYERTGDYDTAIEHYLASGNRDKGTAVFTRFAEELLEAHQYEKIETLLGYFTREEIAAVPMLLYYERIILNVIKPFSSRRQLLSLLPYFEEQGDTARQARIYSELLHNYFFYQENETAITELIQKAEEFTREYGKEMDPSRVEILNALINLGEWSISPEKAEAFSSALRVEEASHKFQDDESLLCARLVLAKIYLLKGEFAESLRLLQRTERFYSQDESNSHYIGLIGFFLGDTHFYLGEIQKAIEHTEKTLAQTSDRFAFKRYLRLNLITYYLYTDNFKQGESLFDSGDTEQLEDSDYLHYFYLYLLQMLIAYRNRNKKRTEYFCSRLMDSENEGLLKSDYPSSYLIIGEINIWLGSYAAAEEYLLHIIATAESGELPYSLATAYALLGFGKLKQEKQEEAKKYFSLLEEQLRKTEYQNLDICDPALLQKLAELSGIDAFKKFPRLKFPSNRKITEELSRGKLDIRTLGTFRIFVKGSEIPRNELTRQKRVIDLFKLLIVFRENGIAKEIVYDIFWPRYTYKNARDNLNTLVYRLRKILGEAGDCIITDLTMVKLREGEFTVDIDYFLSCFGKGKAAERSGEKEAATEHYSNAAELYKGDFLELGLYIDHIRDERENLKNKYRQILLSLAKLNLDLGKYRESLEWAKTLTTFDTLCEPAYRLMMIASAFTENRIEITRIYEKLRETLFEAFSISPDKKTENLKSALLTGSPPVFQMWQEETII